jgi:hypothetical protein
MSKQKGKAKLFDVFSLHHKIIYISTLVQGCRHGERVDDF